MPFKPSEKEEEYILRQEWDRRKTVEQERQKLLAKEEKERLKKLHHMKCCKCGMEMISLDFKGSPSIGARTARALPRQGGTRRDPQ